MKRTPLFEGHRAAGGRLVDFAGWEMPMQYTGVVDEYQTVRKAAGLFDVSHMGRITVAGDGALSFLQRVTTNNVEKLAVLESQYSIYFLVPDLSPVRSWILLAALSAPARAQIRRSTELALDELN
jgi:glycine cleavage system aminomethyltransferase T